MADPVRGTDVQDRTCSVEGCDRIRRAKGWCSKHYYKLRADLCTARACTRPLRAKGLCAQHYRDADERQRDCRECGVTFAGDIRSSFCSRACKNLWMKGPVRRAVESGDPAGVIAAARSCSVTTASGCWEWQLAKNPAGYPMIGQGGKGGLVHRHVAAATVGRPLGNEPVHHKCANRACVNPEHLQPITHRENLAEMFERNHYVRRIAELEAALVDLAPDHPLIST